MVKYKIREESIYNINIGYYVLRKKHWWSLWDYICNENNMAIKFDTRKMAESYINIEKELIKELNKK